MPQIAAAGTYNSLSGSGFEPLRAPRPRKLYFAGSSIGTQALVQYEDDQGTFQTFENGTITSLPKSIIVDSDKNLQIVVTGSPDFNLTIE